VMMRGCRWRPSRKVQMFSRASSRNLLRRNNADRPE
jgi:hypothetical protein